jgi:hypothetical protein
MSTHSCLIRLVKWSTGLLAGQPVGSLVDWLEDSLVGWLVRSFVRCLEPVYCFVMTETEQISEVSELALY